MAFPTQLAKTKPGIIQSKQTISESTDGDFKNSRKSKFYIVDNSHSHIHRHRRHSLSPLAGVRRSKTVTKCKDHLSTPVPDRNITNIETESSRRVQASEENENQYEVEQAQLRRAMYNARQTPLIPFITELDFPVLYQSLQQQNGLFSNITNLFNSIDEECSFFEQFRF